MSEERIVRRTLDDKRKGKTDWARVDTMTEDELEKAARADPDAQPTDMAFWEGAEIVMPEPKERVTMRLDKEVLDWFRKGGKGYQTRMNAVLRAYMEARTSSSEKRPD